MPPALRAAAGLGISFRAETEEDRDFLVALYASTRAEELALTGWPPEMKIRFVAQQHHAQQQHFRQRHPDCERLLIVRGGDPIGRFYYEESASEIHVIDVALMPDSRGQGIGGAVLGDMIEQARAAGKPLTLNVLKTSPARRLYLRLGFVDAGASELHFRMEWRG